MTTRPRASPVPAGRDHHGSPSPATSTGAQTGQRSKAMAGVTLETRAEGLCRRRRGREGRVARHRGRLVLRAGRPLGLRQVHAAAHDRRARDDLGRRGRDRRPRRQRGRAGRARHRDGVPELRALSAHERLRQHGLRPAQPRHAEGRDRDARARGRAHPRHRALPAAQAARSSPAASASASPWAAPSCASRRSSCSTSRSRTSTPSCACRCASRSSGCSGRSASPRSTSRTTRSRR